MSDSDQTIYALFAECAAACLPLENAMFSDGESTKQELIAQLRRLLRDAEHG